MAELAPIAHDGWVRPPVARPPGDLSSPVPIAIAAKPHTCQPRPLLGAAALLLACLPATVCHAACPPVLGEPAQVAAVGDRFEIELADGRIVQPSSLAPFQAHGPQPGDAGAARDALAQWMIGTPVRIPPNVLTSDRWGRLAVPVFAGEDGQLWSVGELLLREGLARYNPRADDPCRASLLVAEQEGRGAKLGLWADPYYAVVAADDHATLGARSGEFVLVEGRVLRIGQTSARIYLNFGAVRGVDFTVTLSRQTAKAFERGGMSPTSLVGKRLRVRGLLETRFGPQIDVSLLEAIESIER